VSKIIVDSNIIFSAILNSQSKIGQLILDGSRYFDFYSVSQLRLEILLHRSKIMKLSGYNENVFSEIFQLMVSKIKFIDDILVPDKKLKEAVHLVSDIDESDMIFVAMTEHLKAILWTGDKKLINGLNRKGYHNIISTEKLYKKYVDRLTAK
jgi:predicted nucleic acid-binding protein